jgi:hypothetical protein
VAPVQVEKIVREIIDPGVILKLQTPRVFLTLLHLRGTREPTAGEARASRISSPSR